MTRPKVVVYDYGSGNLRSAERALVRAGADVTVTADQVAAVTCDGVVVPGVGAFAACVEGIEDVGGRAVIGDRVARERPVLGICIGMQVLFDTSEEGTGRAKGLAALSGTVRRLDAPVLPHMGWNIVERTGDSRLLAGIADDERFYFVHSFAPDPDDRTAVTGWTTHGTRFASVVEHGVLCATQFHPEKSGAAGAALLANWVGSL